MDVKNLIEAFSEFKEMKNIDRETMMNILEEVFRTVLAKQYSTDENIAVSYTHLKLPTIRLV